MLLPISNTPRDYAWGSGVLLAALEGRAPSGLPEAETWFGDHPGAPSLVEDGTGRRLDAWLAAERPGTRLPFLLKLLAAASSLSIQAHPSKAQAEAGFAREDAAGIPRDAAERNYRDDNHKPEFIVALSDEFHALVGLRETDATRPLLDELGDGTGVRALRDRLGAGGDEALRGAIAWLLSADAASDVADIVAAVLASPSRRPELALARRLAREFPGDAGVVVALLMNPVTLRRGQGMFVPAGVLHAYRDGLGVELMAASDNVLRGGLTPKHIDAAELSAVLDPAPGPVAVREPRPVAGGLSAYDVPVADFSLLRAELASGAPVELTPRGDAIVLATAGEVRVVAGDATLTLRPGRAALVTADEPLLRLSGTGEAFVAQPG